VGGSKDNALSYEEGSTGVEGRTRGIAALLGQGRRHSAVAVWHRSTARRLVKYVDSIKASLGDMPQASRKTTEC
jgi:hypothetical protein